MREGSRASGLAEGGYVGQRVNTVAIGVARARKATSCVVQSVVNPDRHRTVNVSQGRKCRIQAGQLSGSTAGCRLLTPVMGMQTGQGVRAFIGEGRCPVFLPEEGVGHSGR